MKIPPDLIIVVPAYPDVMAQWESFAFSNNVAGFQGRPLVLLCHKSNFALALPQQGHCPRRAISV